MADLFLTGMMSSMKRPLAILLPIIFFFTLLSVSAWKMMPGGTAGQMLAPMESEQQKMQRMLDRARKHMVIADPNPFVGQVKNVQFLRTQFTLYDAARDGDILIVTQATDPQKPFEALAILYDPVRDRITSAISRREAYGEHVPPGIRRLTESASSGPAMCPCTAQRSSAAPWVLQPVGGSSTWRPVSPVIAPPSLSQSSRRNSSSARRSSSSRQSSSRRSEPVDPGIMP